MMVEVAGGKEDEAAGRVGAWGYPLISGLLRLKHNIYLILQKYCPKAQVNLNDVRCRDRDLTSVL